MNKVIELLKAHRSIRKYEEKAVEEEKIRAIIEAAQCASTSSFVQAYSIIGVKDPEKKAKLAKLSGEQIYVEKCPIFLVFCADVHRLNEVCQLHNSEMNADYTETFLIATIDAALAAQNAIIAAESLGLGGVYVGGIRNNPVEVCELLEIPKNVYPVFGICLGYPAHNPETKPRLPLEVVYKEEKYSTEGDIARIKEYDQQVKEYYIKRTRGKRSDTWTQQMAEKGDSELRPHMREFLKRQGFTMK